MSRPESAALIRNRYFDGLSATPGLYWLGQNTNHIESHPAVREAMLRSIEAGEFNAYAPPLGFEALRSAIVTDLGTPDAEALKAHVDERTAIIYLVDPNNPLGIRYSRKEIESFVAIARDCGALLVHDCTYRDFADGHTPALHVAPEGAVVSMSFSKWLGLAGLHIGALVAAPELFGELAQTSTSVLGASVVAQRAAQHLGSVVLGGEVLRAAAGDGFAGAQAERSAAAILKGVGR